MQYDIRDAQGGVEVPANDQALDGTSATGDSVSRVYNFGDVTAIAAGKTGGVDEKDSYGLITRFNAINAVSRKVHGSAGTFDIGLPLVGTPGIECRSGGATNNYHVVVTFGGSDVSIPMSILIGDTNADRFTGAVDVSQTRSQSGNADERKLSRRRERGRIYRRRGRVAR